MYVIVGGHTEIIYFKHRKKHTYLQFCYLQEMLNSKFNSKKPFAIDVQTSMVYSEYETNAR